jgi:zinc transport system substrate-binding protein
VTALSVLATLSSGCARHCGGPPARPHVVVSIFPIYDLTRRVAGPDADVALMLPPGRSEHGVDPGVTAGRDRARGAKLGVLIGLGLDTWLETALKDAAPEARLLKVGDRVPTLEAREASAIEPAPEAAEDATEENGPLDPHVWLDPQRAQLIVRAVAEELGRVDTAHALAYRERATEIDRALAALDEEVERRTKALSRRGFVTFHAAFRYFAERYRLEVLAVVEPEPGKEPSPAHAARVRDILRAKSLPVLFTEPQLDPRPARALADEAKVAIGVLDPIGGGPETEDYEKTIRFNVSALEHHLK